VGSTICSLCSSSGTLGVVAGLDTPGKVDITDVKAEDVPKDGVRIETTQAQDVSITGNATQAQADYASGKAQYNMYSNNCKDAAVTAVTANTGISVPNADTPRPAPWFENLKENQDKVENPELPMDED